MKTCVGRKAKQIWKSTGGNSTPLTIALVLTILLLICTIAEFARLNIIAGGVRNGLQQAVVSVAVTNYDEVYSGLREGYSGGYQLEDGEWLEHVDYGDVYGQLDKLLGTEKSGGYHVKLQEDGYEYRLSGLNLVIEQPSLAPGETDLDFKADIWITIEIPLSFGWELVPPLKMVLHTQAVYMSKF